ncbi:transposase [Nitrosomonas mobilis]|uniref:transposase n=1 Tax=Nitrosomonas mobilis TaxID=51642 RepID=UPI003CCC3B9A
MDDAYLDGELAGGKAGRDSKSKVPFVAAISFGAEGRPCMIKMALIFGFTCKVVFDWATADLAPGCIVTSDGLSCFQPGFQDGSRLFVSADIIGPRPACWLRQAEESF